MPHLYQSREIISSPATEAYQAFDFGLSFMDRSGQLETSIVTRISNSKNIDCYVLGRWKELENSGVERNMSRFCSSTCFGKNEWIPWRHSDVCPSRLKPLLYCCVVGSWVLNMIPGLSKFLYSRFSEESASITKWKNFNARKLSRLPHRVICSGE